MPPVYGKHRGTVTSNLDPLRLGRLEVTVPQALGEGRTAWAMPCVPYAGKGVGWFALPPVGAHVWVEFENGDVNFPIWTGGFWGSAAELPVVPPIAETKVFRSNSTTLMINDLPGAGGVTLSVDAPAVPVPVKVAIDANGVAITLGPTTFKVSMTEAKLAVGAASVHLSPTTVSINNGALEVI